MTPYRDVERNIIQERDEEIEILREQLEAVTDLAATLLVCTDPHAVTVEFEIAAELVIEEARDVLIITGPKEQI